MAEHRQNPDPAPHGRHAQRGAAQPDGQAAREGAGQRQPRQQPRQAHSASQQPVRQEQRAAQRSPAQPQQGQQPRQQMRPQRQEPSRQGDPRRQAAATSRGDQSRRQAASPQARRQPQIQQGPQGPRHGVPPQGSRPAQAGAMVPAAYGASRGGKGGGGKGGQGDQGGQGGKKKGGPWRAVFWVALVVFVAALAALGAIAFSYWQGQNAYDSVAQDVFAPPEDIEGTSLADITVDWDKLKAMNPETVGWIYITGTPVNYPIVHTTDDEKYLATDFNGQQTWGATYGSIFLAAANAADFSDANNIVYGHNLNNGSMFACIAGFEKAEVFNEHRTAYLLTPQGNFKLRTFSLVHVAADDPLAQTAFADDAERTAYFQDKIDRSTVEAPDAPQAADIAHGFAFATCDNLPSDGRYVLYSYLEESTVPGVEALGGSGAALDPEAAAAMGDAAKEVAA